MVVVAVTIVPEVNKTEPVLVIGKLEDKSMDKLDSVKEVVTIELENMVLEDRTGLVELLN